MHKKEALHTLARQFREAESVLSVENIQDRLLLVRPDSDRVVVTYLVDEFLPPGAVKKAMRDNTQRGLYTLFMLSIGLLPPDREVLQLPQLLHVLQTLYHAKIYAYHAHQGQVDIIPIQFRASSGTVKRQIIYTEPVENLGLLKCQHVETGYPIPGFWGTAGFQPKAEERDYHFDPSQYESFQQEYRRHQAHHNPHQPARQPSRLKQHYDVLGLAYNADEEDIKRAYRELARRFHPDLSEKPNTKERMQAINLAYRELMKQFK